MSRLSGGRHAECALRLPYISTLAQHGIRYPMYVEFDMAQTFADNGQVPVIYLVEPTAQNLQIVTSDLSRGLYSASACNGSLSFI
jgi:hypothetical protein